jgi:cell wall-associated NlpC family hydrolase
VRSFFLFFFLSATLLAEPAYHSPYSVKFSFPEKDLIGDLAGPRGDWKKEATVPYQNWYSGETRKRFGVWGPTSQPYSAPPGIEQKGADWKRQRIIATALRFQGYRYQHHHIPDWDPPADWPYKQSPLGRQSKGLDCSNFTSFVYNLALGLKFSGGTQEQAEMTEVQGPGQNKTTKVEKIEEPSDHQSYEELLKSGDLLFIRGKPGGEITHVVLWVGNIGKSKNDVPLIIDSTGEGRKDEDGNAIPDGIQLRPFAANSWYLRSAAHALRLIPDK